MAASRRTAAHAPEWFGSAMENCEQACSSEGPLPASTDEEYTHGTVKRRSLPHRVKNVQGDFPAAARELECGLKGRPASLFGVVHMPSIAFPAPLLQQTRPDKGSGLSPRPHQPDRCAEPMEARELGKQGRPHRPACRPVPRSDRSPCLRRCDLVRAKICACRLEPAANRYLGFLSCRSQRLGGRE